MRRQTLGPVSGSSLNARSSLGRPSLGGGMKASQASRMSDIGLTKSRQSMGAAASAAAEQPRRSSAASRRSSAYGVRGAADPRPLGDKEYMNTAIGTLIEYLMNSGYDQRMDFANKGWRPTSRDFQNICTFLFAQLDPNWQCRANKFEDEFITVFKTLGYPYTISKTSLSAVGSPHAWPQLLGALAWLVELLNYDNEVALSGGHAACAKAFVEGGAAGSSSGDDMTREGDRRFIDYLGHAYRHFLSGDDETFDALEGDFSASFAEQTGEVRALVATKDAEHARLVREIEAEKQTGATLPVKKEKLSVLESDHEKLCVFVAQLQDHCSTLEGKVEMKQKDLDAEKSSVESVKETVKTLKARVSTQELSADEAQRMVAEKERLERNLNEATAYHQGMRQKAWEADMELQRRVEELERACHGYTAQATALQLLPVGAKNASAVDFRMVVNKEKLSQATCLGDALCTDVKGVVMPALVQFKELVASKANQLRTSANLLADQEEHSEEAVEEATTQLAELEQKKQKLEEALKREKEGVEAALSERAIEQEEIEEAINLLRDNPAERERKRAGQQRRLAELRSQIEQQTEANDSEAERTQKQILAALGQIADYKAHVGRELQGVKDFYVDCHSAIASSESDESLHTRTGHLLAQPTA